MSLALALGQDPATLPRANRVAGAAASLVYRAFSGGAAPAMPTRCAAGAPEGAVP
jgi:hypothetical protein